MNMSWQPVGLKGNRLQKRLAGPYFAVFLTNRTTIGLQNRQNLFSPSHFSLRFFKSDRLLDNFNFFAAPSRVICRTFFRPIATGEPMKPTIEEAPGAPGIPPTWCSSAKEMVGCALGPSRLWFTIGGGIVNEVYYPRVDIPQIRDLGFIVADNEGFWAEVKRLDSHQLIWASQGVPAIEIVHQHARFELRL